MPAKYPDNTIAGLQQCSSKWLAKLPDDTSTKHIEFNYLTDHPYICKPDHITLVLNSLHWLPVIYRSLYKILMNAYRALHGTVPRYLEEFIVAHQPIYSVLLFGENPQAVA